MGRSGSSISSSTCCNQRSEPGVMADIQVSFSVLQALLLSINVVNQCCQSELLIRVANQGRYSELLGKLASALRDVNSQTD